MLSFFMADDTLAIFEPPLKNSGVVGGKYLERRQVTNPSSTRWIITNDSGLDALISPQEASQCRAFEQLKDMPHYPCRLITDLDLHVGAIIPILQRNFELLDADEFTLQYMENNRQVYVMADAERALQALALAFKAGADKPTRSGYACNCGFYMPDMPHPMHAHDAGNSVSFGSQERESSGENSSATGYMSLSQLEDSITRSGVGLSKHQVLSIYRRMPKDTLQRVSTKSLLEAIAA